MKTCRESSWFFTAALTTFLVIMTQIGCSWLWLGLLVHVCAAAIAPGPRTRRPPGPGRGKKLGSRRASKEMLGHFSAEGQREASARCW